MRARFTFVSRAFATTSATASSVLPFRRIFENGYNLLDTYVVKKCTNIGGDSELRAHVVPGVRPYVATLPKPLDPA